MSFTRKNRALVNPVDSTINIQDLLNNEIQPEDLERSEDEERSSSDNFFSSFESRPHILGVKNFSDPITVDTLNRVIYELGIIPLCWPVITEPEFETRSCFPESYYKNSEKEKIVLAYAENFRQQFCWKYPKRRPILLQAFNDCGLQKMVCTTIRPTWLPFPEMHTWEGCASFVSEYLDFEVSSEPMLLPKRILSPYTVLKRQRGNSFECATLLASYLIGAGFDAYAVFGYAARDQTLGSRGRVACPGVPVAPDPPKPEEDRINKKYKVASTTDLRSLHQVRREEQRRECQQAAAAEAREAERLATEELERPPPDPLHGWRTHAWVLLLPAGWRARAESLARERCQEAEALAEGAEAPAPAPDREAEPPDDQAVRVPAMPAEVVTEPSPAAEEKRRSSAGSEGGSMGGDAESGAGEEGGESGSKEEAPEQEVAEDQQEEETPSRETEKPSEEVPFFIEPATGLRFEITHPQYLGVESIYNHKNYYVYLHSHPFPESFDLTDINWWHSLLWDEEQNLPIRHLDMPASWVERLEVTPQEFQRRFPGGSKELHFKKVIEEKFAPFSRADGLFKRLKIFEDYEYTIPVKTYEWYNKRSDYLREIQYNYTIAYITEFFDKGREDYLKEHKYEMGEIEGVEIERQLDFFSEPRPDLLMRLQVTPGVLTEHYAERPDRLYKREIEFSEQSDEGDIHRNVLYVAEYYHRNPNIPANEDMAEKIYFVANSEFRVLFHFQEHFVTMSSRDFVKPNLLDSGGVLLFDTDLTSGYVANPRMKEPRPLWLYHLLVKQMAAEEVVLAHARDMEKQLHTLLSARALELSQPEVKLGLFDVDQNEQAKQNFENKEKAEKEIYAQRYAKVSDPGAPYVARYGRPLTPIDISQCLRDFTQTQLARQNLLQARYNERTISLREQKLWYLTNLYTISPKDEEEYFKKSDNLLFEVKTLEVQMERHKKMSAIRYQQMKNQLDPEPVKKKLEPEVTKKNKPKKKK